MSLDKKLSWKVFIENEAGSLIKHIFDEKKLKYKDSIKVARPYPYPYGFIVNTTGADNDNVDAFVLTHQKLKRGHIVDCEVLGVMEQFELSWDEEKVVQADHNILMKLVDEQLGITIESQKGRLRDFVLHVFDTVRLNKTRVGKFLGKEEALAYIKKHVDK